MARVAAIAELKARLSEYLKIVKSGTEVVVTERGNPIARIIPYQLREDSAMVAWWGSPVECWSAFARLSREGVLDETAVQAATERLDTLRQAWVEVLPTEQVRNHAARLLRIHPLRAADALQLAAAPAR